MLRSVILIPMIMPPFVGAIGMQKLFGLYGSINMFLVKLGLIDMTGTIDWFGGGFWGCGGAFNAALVSDNVS